MARRWLRLAMAAVTAGGTACGGGEQVLLGREQRAKLSDTPCVGPACAEPASDAEAPPPPPTVACADEDAGQLAIALRVSPPPQHGCPDGARCQLDLNQLTPAVDGSVWVVGTIWLLNPLLSNPRYWLAHFAADGAPLGEWIGDGGYAAQLALDDRGQVWLANGPFAPTTVQRFDTEAKPVGKGIPVWSVRNLVPASGRGVAVLTGDNLAVYGYDGELQRSEAFDAQTSPNALVSGRTGFALLTAIAIAPSSSFGGFVESESRLAVKAVDPDFHTRWSLQSALTVLSAGTPVSDLSDWGSFSAFDRDGNLVLATRAPDANAVIGQPFFPSAGALDIESIDGEGHSRWTLRAPSSFNLGIALAPSGEVWVADFEGARPSADGGHAAPNGHIAVIAQDGSSCRRYAYEGIEMVNALEFSAQGELWFLDYNAFGRFAPPAP